MKRTIVLAILDGWGIGAMDESNPIYIGKPPTIDMIEKNFPAGALQASGIAMGLPWEEEGNSEVGHLTIGCGRVLYQHFPKITLSVESGEFFKNSALVDAFAHARTNDAAVHLVGLLTKGNVHASLPHIGALIDMASREKCTKLYLHLITDGRDSPPESAADLLTIVRAKIATFGVGEIVSVIGRYYAMNRDEHWDRTQKAYTLLTSEKAIPQKFEDVAKRTYDKGFNDEFIDPAALTEPHPIRANDAVIFFNYREDSMRQITKAFLDPEFSAFPITPIPNLYVATMTQYHDTSLPAHIAFPNEEINETLGKVISDSGRRQLRIAETQKYAHVTYFFNGLHNEPYPEEYRVLIPSLDTPHPESAPAMMASAITDRALSAIQEGVFDLIVMNYANPDILAHTGNFQATLEAIHIVDKELARLVNATLNGGHTLIITSDHGNAEVVLDMKTGNPETRHNISPVPFYIINNSYRKPVPLERSPRLQTVGLLSDVAPTILEIFGIDKPEEMTGESVLNQLLY